MITEEIKNELKSKGCNYDALVQRFMNMDKLAEKFLKKFPADNSIELFAKAVEDDNAEEIFSSTHTMKGLCGNLCMDSILKELEPVVENARAGKTEGAKEAYKEIQKMYDEICEVIGKIS